MQISIPAPAKGATFWITAFLSTMRFQSTLPRRERRVNRMVNYMKKQFQSTLPRRERPRWRYLLRIRNQFQSTLPRRERHRNDTAFGTFILFQSTLPRRERPSCGWICLSTLSISIPAPAKGVTEKRCTKLLEWKFQSTLPRRERHAFPDLSVLKIVFQSTLPRRERHVKRRRELTWKRFHSTLPRRERLSDTFYKPLTNISIHAPAKGATTICFITVVIGKFQSTLPRRERRWQNCIYDDAWNFNPRSREGSDVFRFSDSDSKIAISIHAPAKGATLSWNSLNL